MTPFPETKTGFPYEELRAALRAADFNPDLCFSPIQGSPYDRFELYVDADAAGEGPHVVVSPAAELEGEEEGGTDVYVGAYRDWETPVGVRGPVRVPLAEAGAEARRQFDALVSR